MSEELRRLLLQRGIIPEGLPPETALSQVDEVKISKKLSEKERLLDKRIRIRREGVRQYLRKNGNGQMKQEVSIADETMRELFGVTLGLRGLAGRISPENVNAFMELKEMVESFQAEYGSDDPLVQTLARMLREAADHIMPRTFAPEDVDVDRVVIQTEPTLPFSGLSVNVPEKKKEENK